MAVAVAAGAIFVGAMAEPALALRAEETGSAPIGSVTCRVAGELSLAGQRMFGVDARLKRGTLNGTLVFRDVPARVSFQATAISGLVVSGSVASIQGRGRTKTGVSLAFSASFDAAARTFELRLSSGYSASGVLAGSRDADEIELEGFCPFDGGSTPLLDTPRRVTGSIGRAGGSLAGGGLTLTIPAGALSEDTTISLTPLLDLADSPLAGSILGGAKLEPEGLRFLRPAVLSFALPAGTPAADVIGFGSAGDGSELHLQPYSVSGGAISLQLWHFSTAGGSSGGGSAAAAVLSRPISNSERQAMQRIAAAHRACNAEVALGVFNGPACANVRPETVRALFDWYSNAVRPGLDQAAAALSFEAEEALAEWLAWQAEVLILFQNDPAGTPRCGTLENECVRAHELATTAVAAHAKRRLENCTGSSLVSQLRDVARMADYAAAGTIDLTSLELPDAANGSLLRACASIRIDPPTFPAVAARVKPNRLSVRAYIGTYTGAQMSSQTLRLTLALANAGVDASSALLEANGRFATNVYPLEGAIGVVVDITVELAEGALPQLTDALLRENFTTTHEVVSPARERLLLVAQGPTAVPAGGTLDLLVLVAGDGMTDDVTLTVGGPGSVGPTPVTPNTEGAATAVYTAPSSTVNPNAQVIATLLDGTSATLPITIAAVVTVSLSPTAATVTTGGTQNFTATVTNSSLGVTWSTTGGAIVATGSTTARYDAGSTPGTFSVTATSISDPTKRATATITITRATTAEVRVIERSSHVNAQASVFDGGAPDTVSNSDSTRDLGLWGSEVSATRSYVDESRSLSAESTADNASDVAGASASFLFSVLAHGSASARATAAATGPESAVATGSSATGVVFELTGGSADFVVDGDRSRSGSGCFRVTLSRLLTDGSRTLLFDRDGCDGTRGGPLQATGRLTPGRYVFSAVVNAGALADQGVGSGSASAAGFVTFVVTA